MMEKEISHYILKGLKKDGRVTIRGLGRFEVRPPRKGKINSLIGGKLKKKCRVSFVPSRILDSLDIYES